MKLIVYACLLVANLAQAQSWPSKPLKLIVGFPAGSTPDVSARIIAEPLGKALGQPVVVENKPGAGGNIAADLVAKATDQHTLGIASNGTFTAAKALGVKLAFDPDRDFKLISLLTVAPLVLLANNDLPEGAVFFARAKASGTTWNYGSVGNGSIAHVGMEYLKTKLPGFNGLHIPFAGNPQVITALLGGQIQLALVPPGLANAQSKAGKLKAIGVTSGKSALAADAPALADFGITDFNLEVWTGLIASAALPKDAVDRISTEIIKIVADADIKQKFLAAGWQPVGSNIATFETRVKSESKALGDIIAARGIKVE